jgi:predicted hydrocarbon binding protein
VGRACFKVILRELGSEIGLSEIASRPYPADEKVLMILKLIADLFNKYSDQQVVLSQAGTKYMWTVNRCPYCWHLRADDPICLQMVGLLQEALYWVSSGKIYSVEEVDCIGKGDQACVIVVDQQPME